MNAGGVDKACKSNAQHHFLDLIGLKEKYVIILLMWFLYIIQHTESKRIYIGRTSSIKRRIKEHNKGETWSTRRRKGKWILVYSEVYRNERDSIIRERKLKQHGRAKQELLKRIKYSLLSPKSGAGSGERASNA